MKRLLIIDRDGTIIAEPPDEQIDAIEKLKFLPRAISTLARIRQDFRYEFVMATNQDGLGTDSFPEATFYPAQNAMLAALESEGVEFDEILIDTTFARDNASTRKPGVGMFGKYLEGAREGAYDLKNSFVIGDRLTDVQLAHNLGAQAIVLRSPQSKNHLDAFNHRGALPALNSVNAPAFVAESWAEIYDFLLAQESDKRAASLHRVTNETDIEVFVNLDGSGKAAIATGLGFFDHMLEQLARHSACDMRIRTRGDLHVDEHHTIEDTALALGAAFDKALGKKRGIERYGYALLPMDEALAESSLEFDASSDGSSDGSSDAAEQKSGANGWNTPTRVALDFSGRSWLIWDVQFRREKIGDVPTEMFYHFFKSFCDAARLNLNVRSVAENEHHKIEATFKAVARAIKAAVRIREGNAAIPSTKGIL
jgi:imidazoleglycerol-phosphate dehydratase/histidinol-phosphatase